jgi:hypothetical protein
LPQKPLSDKKYDLSTGRVLLAILVLLRKSFFENVLSSKVN